MASDWIKRILGGHAKRRITRDSKGNIGFKFWAPERIEERQTGCWNCMHFDNGEKALQHFQRVLRPGQLRVFLENGMTMEDAESALRRQIDPYAPPRSGLCMKSDAPRPAADLVHAAYKCAMWTGRIRPEGKQDELIEDIKDKRGEN